MFDKYDKKIREYKHIPLSFLLRQFKITTYILAGTKLHKLHTDKR